MPADNAVGAAVDSFLPHVVHALLPGIHLGSRIFQHTSIMNRSRHENGATDRDMRQLIFWLLPVTTSFIVMLGALLLYTVTCAIHYYYNITHL